MTTHVDLGGCSQVSSIVDYLSLAPGACDCVCVHYSDDIRLAFV